MSERKKLLLHCCCGPCAAGVLDRLGDYDVTLCFVNPNIDTREEYDLRAEELARLNRETLKAPLILPPYNPAPFYDAAKGLENEPEGGRRCAACMRLRLGVTIGFAGPFDLVTTTLSVSPHKNAALINEIGKSLTDKWLAADFKKKDGFKRSIEVSRAHGLYRQNYCGCVFARAAGGAERPAPAERT